MTGENITLAGLPSDKNVILLSGYDYNDNRTSLKANIGGTLTDTDGASAVTGGTNDFQEAANYDALGDMTSLSQTAQSTGDSNNGVTAKNVTFSYDADQRTSTESMYQSSGTSNLVVTAANTYDADSDLTDLTYTTGTGDSVSTLAAYQWSYDTDGRVTDEYSDADTSDTTDRTSSYTTWSQTSYGYDHDSELTGTSYTNFANAPTTNLGATFDTNGNRESTTATVAGTSTTTDSSSSTNELLFDGAFYYNYDPSGNRIAKFNSTTGVLDSSATNITIYAWNNANELVSVKTYDTYAAYAANDTPTSEVDYGNDPFGQTVSRTVKDSSGDVTESDNYIYDGGNVALVLNADGEVTQRNLYGPAVDQILATENVAPTCGEQAAGLVNWLLPDNQGTIRDVAQYSDGATNVVDHLAYDSFGAITGQYIVGTYYAAGETIPSDLAVYQPFITFAGMQLDTSTGLLKDGLRQYDSNNSIFVSQDPIGYLDGGTNLAMYCWNSPTNYTDPTGLAGGAEDDEDVDDDEKNELLDTLRADPTTIPQIGPPGTGPGYGQGQFQHTYSIEDLPEPGDSDSDDGTIPEGFGPSSGWQYNREPGNPYARGNAPWRLPFGDSYVTPQFSLPPADETSPSPAAQQAIAQAQLEENADAARAALANAKNPSSSPLNDPLQHLGVKPTETPEQALKNLLRPVGTIQSGSSSGGGSSAPVQLNGPASFGKNFATKVRKHIDQIRNRGTIQEAIPSPGRGGLETVEQIIRSRVAQGGGRATTYAGEPAVAFEDGGVTYIFRPNGEFWTVLGN